MGGRGESNIHTPAAIRQLRPIVMLLPIVNDAAVADAGSAADDQRGMLRVSRREREAAFAVDQHVIADDEIAAALHPVNEDVCADVAAIAFGSRP